MTASTKGGSQFRVALTGGCRFRMACNHR